MSARPRSDQSSSEFDSDFDHRPHSTFIADAIRLAASRPLLINHPNSKNKPSSTSTDAGTLPPVRQFTARTTRSGSLTSQDDDMVTEPLKIKRTSSTSVVARSSTHAEKIPTATMMNVTASHVDRQFEDTLYHTIHPFETEIGRGPSHMSSVSQTIARFPSNPTRPRFSRMKSAPTLSRNDSAAETAPLPLPDEDEANSSETSYYGQRSNVASTRKSLRMAGSRPPSVSLSSHSRSRAQSVRSRASSAASCPDERDDQPVSGYLFLHEIPPLPPFPKPPSKSRPKPSWKDAEQSRSGLPNLERALSVRSMMNETKEGTSPFQPSKTDTPSLPSPQHVWYFLRVLVGLELRWEFSRAWKLTSLDHIEGDRDGNNNNNIMGHYALPNDDGSTYSHDSSSTTEPMSSDHFPILRYLIRHFLLTFPIIRDIVSVDPTHINASESNQEDNDNSPTIPIYWTAGIIPILRRFQQANLSTSIDLGSRGFLEIMGGVHVMGIIERFVSTGIKILDEPVDLKRESLQHTLESSRLDPSFRDASATSLSRYGEQMKGIGKEWQRISAGSHAASQRAEIGTVTPSNSYHIGKISPRADSRLDQSSHRDIEESNNYERVANKTPSADPEYGQVRLGPRASNSDLTTWLPNVFNQIEAPAMNLSDTVGSSIRHESDNFRHPPTDQTADGSKEESEPHSIAHQMYVLALEGSETDNMGRKTSHSHQMSNSLSRFGSGRHRAMASPSEMSLREGDASGYPDNPLNAQAEKSSVDSLICSPSARAKYQRPTPVEGYTIPDTMLYPDSSTLHLDLESSQKLQAPHVYDTSSAHYRKRSENAGRSDDNLLDGAEKEHVSGQIPGASDVSRKEVGTSSRKRRFTLRSISRWMNTPPKSSEDIANKPVDIPTTSRLAPASSSHLSINAMSPTISRDNTDNSSEMSENQPRHRFYAAMAVPETLYQSSSKQQYRHGVVPKVPSKPVKKQLPPVCKQGIDWPWGHPVPFWKGTPIHKVSWGGFEVDVVGLRKTFRGHSFLIRVRRPSRMDEYVLRDESHFKRYLAVLDKEFPNAVIRRIPSSDIRPEDDVIDPVEVTDFFLRPTLDLGRVSERQDHSTEEKNETYSAVEKQATGPAWRINVQPPSTINTTRTNDQNGFSGRRTGEDTRIDGYQKRLSSNVTPTGTIRRRNTLGSLFRGGNHHSKFSLETPSDHGVQMQTEPSYLPDRIKLNRESTSAGKPNNFSTGLARKLSKNSSKASHDAHRRALRGWLRDTLSIRMVGHHRETAAFLLLNSIIPKEIDLLEIRDREAVDRDRRERRILVAQGAAERAKLIHEWWREVVEEFVSGDGLNNLSDEIRKCRKIDELPNRFRKSIEWIQMNIAQGIHDLLVIVELLFFKKGTLNKGRKSLMQRLINIAINEDEEDPLSIQKRIHSCRARIQSLTMCEKLIKFAYADRETKQLFRTYADSERLELVVTIVRSAEEPRLDKYDLERVVRASKVYASLLRKNRNRITKSMTENISVRLILDLKLYLRLVSQERDTKQVQEIFSESSTLEAFEILVTPFLEFLKRTYKIGNGPQAVDDSQKFIEQLITILTALRNRIQDPQKSVRIIARLLDRHQQTLYAWIRSIHTHDSIFEEIFQWAWTAMMFLRRGLSEPVLLPQILPTTGNDALKSELDDLVHWESLKRKLQYEHLCRRYSSDVDGDDPVIVEGDGFGKSKLEPLVEISPRPPRLEQIPRCLSAFRNAISQTCFRFLV
ncbi:uncharacterized protein MELLADRAFT_94195 [Melampsora larici-populina 98AG31]|uniref:PX domain-containing protein n=1 Tax=Melampsora larici-populina (strain 98AG31 / pathotype 3-4-7) TaxID=747676 RepID=F4S6U1_MELLP|nr:uncharacterized protein MELLADRAFT_94195 [Melampsora larici-populina 98AG31]EGF99633.1 hypothetical protein MELLADRAFT_94195 [Melampsora larici-populina 98AG31]